jgi:hypothetical protein
MDVTCGVPQGSVLAPPPPWNTLYDGVLRIGIPEGTNLIAFADNLAIMAVSKSLQELQNMTNDALRKISQWTRENALKIAPQKTECTLLIGRRKAEGFTIKVENVEVKPKSNVKYLGVIFIRA